MEDITREEAKKIGKDGSQKALKVILDHLDSLESIGIKVPDGYREKLKEDIPKKVDAIVDDILKEDKIA